MKNTIINSVIFLLICIIFQSCGQNNKSTGSNELADQTEDSLKLKLNIKDFKEIKLSAEADTLTRQWPMYQDLKNEISRLRSYTLQDVISNVSTLEKVVDSLQETIPKRVDTFPVTSRINVLNTKAKYMLQISEKQKPKLSEIKKIAEEYPLEFNALNTQLNEIFIELPSFED